MDKTLILTIDIGLSFCKVAIGDGAGYTLLSDGIPTPIINPSPDCSEMDTTELWQTTAAMIKRIIAVLPDDAVIAAVGVSGHGNGAYFVDAANKPLGNAVTSMDLRAQDELTKLPPEAVATLKSLSQQRLWAGQPGMILRWLKRKEPERYAGIAKVMCCKDFISLMLTGQCHTDYGDISASGLFNNVKGEYDDALLRALGLPELRDKLPLVLCSFDIRGGVTPEVAQQTGLTAGTPVIGGMLDVDACIYGAGVFGGDCGCSIAGTWNINAAVVSIPGEYSEIRQCIRRGDGTSFLLIDSSATSSINIEWLVKKFFAGSMNYAAVEENLRRYCWTEHSPYWLPFVNGSLDTAAEKGAWLGINLTHGSQDLTAAVVEGICFAHRFHLENLKRSGAVFEQVRLTGGAANSTFSRLLADCCGMTVVTIKEKQSGMAGVRGAALTALGLAATINEALPVTVDQTFWPDLKRYNIFNQRYNRFKELIKCHL